MSRRLVRGAAALVLGLVAGRLEAQAPASFVQQLQGYLGQYQGEFINAGYSVFGVFQTGGLAQGAASTHTVNLTGGMRYAIIGVCDNDCTDVDLALTGPSGESIASDYRLDDHPTLRFTAPSTGTYNLRVSMATCRQAPCYYGVQLYGAGGGGSAPSPMPITGGGTTPPNAMGMIGLNQQVTGNLTVSDYRYDGKPMQAWGFNCSPGMSFQMDILSTWDNYAVVFDPMGNSVARNDDDGDGLNARINLVCSMAGMYRLGVTTYTSSTQPGPYTLQVQGSGGAAMPQPIPQPTPMAQPMAMPVPGPGEMGNIAMGQTANGRLEEGDRTMTDGTWADIWQFQGQSGQSVTIELRSSEFDTYVQLLDGNGNRLAEDDDSLGDLDSRVIFRLPSTGMFQIVVNNFGDTRRAGAYTLTLR